MTHDPLCPTQFPYPEPTACLACTVVARVREDCNKGWREYIENRGGWDNREYAAGYAAALRDAVDNCWGAVAEIQAVELWDGTKAAWWIVKADALAAIEALGGER